MSYIHFGHRPAELTPRRQAHLAETPSWLPLSQHKTRNTRQCIYQIFCRVRFRPTAEAAQAWQQTDEFQQSSVHRAVHCHSPTHRQHFDMQQWLSRVQEHSDKHALGHYPKAQCAFKILMIHEVLQFALRIAFRCVLHRCGIQDIHC